MGYFIGIFTESDSNNFDGTWRKFLRIKVSIDVREPIKRRMKIEKPFGDCFWVKFKYEKLLTFCFFYCIIGHAERDCEKLYDHPIDKAEYLYGAWLRVDRSNFGPRDKWLRSTAPSKMEREHTKGGDRMLVDVDPRQNSSTAKGKEIIENNLIANVQSTTTAIITPDKEGEDQANEEGAVIADLKRCRL